MTSLRALFSMYCFDYSRGTLSVTFNPNSSAENVTKLWTDVITDSCEVLNNVANVHFIGTRDRLETMRQLYVLHAGMDSTTHSGFSHPAGIQVFNQRDKTD